MLQTNSEIRGAILSRTPNTNYNPDVLTCLANLSNDEVFTPPTLVNSILDLLPQELWSNPEARFLDPVSKSGVFLREMAKRLMVGLEAHFPDPQLRINHILKNQLFGIAITELTSLLSRRSVYCSKIANHQKYSLCNEFTDEQGNIRYERMQHTWLGSKCKYCGASKAEYDRDDSAETYAYNFIHIDNPLEIFKLKNMKFDVVVGNPPYQLSDGGGTGDSAKPIYHLFFQQAKKLNPKYISMITPSRWMKGGKGLDNFRNEMINDKHISFIYDFEDAKECFNGLNIDGGVCYFLWDYQNNSELDFFYKPRQLDEIYSRRFLKNNFSETVIRDYRQISIVEKIFNQTKNKFSQIVSSRKPYGISTDLFNDPLKYGYEKIPSKPFKNSYKIYGVKGNKGGAKRLVGYIDKDKVQINESVSKYKLFQSYAYSTTSTVPPEIIIGLPNEISTETFLLIGPFETKYIAENCLSYTKTKFYRALLYFNRIQKNLSQSTFNLIPLQDFSEPWTDEKLYRKYGLTEEEIAFVDSMIRPMEG